MNHDDAILVTEDGTVTTINLPANREHFAEYAAAVLRCASIEAFDLTAGVVIWADEEGRGRRPFNASADALANRYGFSNAFSGPVLITGYGARVRPLHAEAADQILRELNNTAD